MKIIFLGTGEAFDENYLNNSSLVVSDKTVLLLDCGMTTPYQLWKYNNDQNYLDAVYISHTHADHYFGLPALLYRMKEEGREKDLAIFSSEPGVIKNLVELGYKGLYGSLGFKLVFHKKKDTGFKDLRLSFARTEHSIDNTIIKIANNGKSVCYSGDGNFTGESTKLCKNCSLLIHEAYYYDKRDLNHGRIIDVIKMAEDNNVKILALTHINREVRKKLTKKNISSTKVDIKVPKDFDQITI